MQPFRYELTDDFVGIISLYDKSVDVGLFMEKLMQCCEDAEKCVIIFFVQPRSILATKILLFFDEFCQKKQKDLIFLSCEESFDSFFKKSSKDFVERLMSA